MTEDKPATPHPEAIDVSGDGIYRHQVGDKDCESGWCGRHGYPHLCECGGLVHADFGDESWDGYWLYEKCDQCGCDYSPAK